MAINWRRARMCRVDRWLFVVLARRAAPGRNRAARGRLKSVKSTAFTPDHPVLLATPHPYNPSVTPVALTRGTRLGVYEIVSAIGAGGRGEGFLATDTRLDRPGAREGSPH